MTVRRVLVTGIGGDLGQAIAKALRISAMELHIEGCDSLPDSIGRAFVAEYHEVPRGDSPEYLAEVEALCARRRIEAVIPSTEPEIRRLAGAQLASATVISQTAECVATFGDKLRTMEALVGVVAVPAFADGTDADLVRELVRRLGFPLVVKGRLSSGSRTLRIVRSESDLTAALTQVPSPLVQEYLPGELGEYSVGGFVAPDFLSLITFRRVLGVSVGLSWEAEVVDEPEVEHYVQLIARQGFSRGSFNVQVRRTVAGPRLLEVNPRFSSLAAARAISGFRDVEWSLRLAFGLPIERPTAYRNVRFRRFFHELVDLGTGFGAVEEWSPRFIARHSA